jgi:hypothetical protein
MAGLDFAGTGRRLDRMPAAAFGQFRLGPEDVSALRQRLRTCPEPESGRTGLADLSVVPSWSLVPPEFLISVPASLRDRAVGAFYSAGGTW